jgi:hypothetical protein
LPSKGALQKAAKLVEELGNIIAPFRCSISLSGAEAVEFHPKDVMGILMVACGLLEVEDGDSESRSLFERGDR